MKTQAFAALLCLCAVSAQFPPRLPSAKQGRNLDVNTEIRNLLQQAQRPQNTGFSSFAAPVQVSKPAPSRAALSSQQNTAPSSGVRQLLVPIVNRDGIVVNPMEFPGELADLLPAGIGGPIVSVAHTPEFVAAARRLEEAHERILAHHATLAAAAAAEQARRAKSKA